MLSYPDITKVGGVNQPQVAKKKSDLQSVHFAVIPTPVKGHKNSLSVFSKLSNAPWRHSCTYKNTLVPSWLFVLQFIFFKN